ncbi:MAG: M23 family metallopeptidase, partial [Alphaproteobacteria bacterium]
AAQPATTAGFAAVMAEAPVPPIPPEPERTSDTASLVIALPTLSAIEGRIEMPFVVRKGDTLMTALTGAGVARADAKAAIDAIQRVFNPRRLRPGQTITVAFASPPGERKVSFIGFALAVEPGKIAEAVRVDATRFRAYERVSELNRTLVRAAGVIHSSLYQAAADAGVASEVMNDLIAALSYDVDFQRELQDGDRFELLYEVFTDDDGAIVRYGSPLYASLEVGGRAIPIYLYALPGEEPDYFHADGQSVRKALLRTPINGAHVTSSFGKRKDPFLGYTREHKGIDFGAPKGTPVLAAGDGVVEYAGKFRGYGKYVRIRHDGTYATAYAHLSKYGHGIEKGARVVQGQVIGYVGCTGRCTGNHLHYEVLVAGLQVDPGSVDLPTGRKLEGAALARFFQARITLDQRFAALATPVAVAQQVQP